MNLDHKALERIKQQYGPTAPNLTLELVAEVERLRTIVNRAILAYPKVHKIVMEVDGCYEQDQNTP